MDKKEKTTAPVSSAPTDAGLSSVQSTTESITDKHFEIKEKQAVLLLLIHLPERIRR